MTSRVMKTGNTRSWCIIFLEAFLKAGDDYSNQNRALLNMRSTIRPSANRSTTPKSQVQRNISAMNKRRRNSWDRVQLCAAPASSQLHQASTRTLSCQISLTTSSAFFTHEQRAKTVEPGAQWPEFSFLHTD
ncbi:hypothetical protein CP532_1039 [Ophiocordyceps camponoti-leonardi (nom. inval.)]|nr:hypothetical protein CP532_1039 [Ophiocordyceps camponoti-leonardi (nom. inval.)]